MQLFTQRAHAVLGLVSIAGMDLGIDAPGGVFRQRHVAVSELRLVGHGLSPAVRPVIIAGRLKSP